MESPLLQTIYNDLVVNYPWLNNVGYSLTHDNTLSSRFVSDTPHVWGAKAADVKPGAGNFIPEAIGDMIRKATRFVDITSLCQFPDEDFQTTIVEALQYLSQTGRPVKVRILVGWFPLAELVGSKYKNQRKFLEELVASLIGLPGNLEIYAATQRTDLLSWNHSKIVAVDGHYALTGGENQWTGDYLQSEPVHDLNVQFEGSSAFYMHQFADRIWESVNKYILPDWKSVYWKSGMTKVEHGCLPHSGLTPPPPGKPDVSILGVGRFGDLDGNPADQALLSLLNSAKKNIFISQEDLLSEVLFWEEGMSAIGKALLNNLDVYIVTSNDGAKSGSGNSYSQATIARTAEEIALFIYFTDFFSASGISWADLLKLLCKRLHLSTLRFGPDSLWPNGFAFANHAKFVMVDESAFYVGSENLYPADLIEYGVIIDHPQAATLMIDNYWSKLWQWSRQVAISGSDAPACYFAGFGAEPDQSKNRWKK